MRTLPAPLALLLASALAPLLASQSGCATSKATTGRAAPLTFIEDDYPRALAQARARGVPLFVDTWAPWCHTCLFMRASVFTDPALGAQRGRFVWLAIDTEKAHNADFLARYPVEVWPTLMVVDPVHEVAALRWPGSATVPQLVRLLDDGQRAIAATAEVAADGDGLALLARADRLGGERSAEAVAAYRAALARVPDDKRPRVVESLVLAQLASHDYAGCAGTAVAEAPSLPRGPSFGNAVATGLACAELAPPSAEWRRGTIGKLEPLADEALALTGLLADDRSGIYEVLVDAREARGDEAGARQLALAWLAFLEQEAGAAPTVEARAAFDPHRVVAALKAGAPERSVAALARTEQELPGDYNPPARLALLHRAMGKLDEAQADVERALGKVYGPRTLRILDLKAQIERARGDAAAARATLERAVRTAEALPSAQGRDALAQRFRDELARQPR